MATLSMFKGETLVYNTTLIVPSTGLPKNLTGARVIYFTLKNQFSETDNNAVAQLFSPTSGVTVVNALLGQITVTMAPTYTYALQGDQSITLVYDIKVIDSAGVQSVLETGTVTVNPTPTRAIS